MEHRFEVHEGSQHSLALGLGYIREVRLTAYHNTHVVMALVGWLGRTQIQFSLLRLSYLSQHDFASSISRPLMVLLRLWVLAGDALMMI